MELREFISKTLKDISDGISESHKYIIDNKHGDGVSSTYKTIEFDVAVATQEDLKTEGGGKITVAGMFSLGGSGESVTALSHTSRVKFSVDIYLNGREFNY